jgi:hypothetical protein
VLCHGPADGNRVTFARPDRLLARWNGVPDPAAAAQVAIPAYLRTYGPATVERFDAWLTRGTSKARDLRAWFTSVDDRLVTVDIPGEEGGDPAYLLVEDADDLAGTKPTSTVRLLPGFDQYVLGHGTAATAIIPPQHRSAVSRTAGWISPVVVAGGRVVGTWDVADGVPQVHLFPDAEPPPAAPLGAEIDRMTELLRL